MKRIAFAIVLGLAAGAAAADPAIGVWQTAPDDNGNFGHVEVTSCGAALCGTLVRAYDASGKEITSPNVGRRIVWDMAPKATGNMRAARSTRPTGTRHTTAG